MKFELPIPTKKGKYKRTKEINNKNRKSMLGKHWKVKDTSNYHPFFKGKKMPIEVKKKISFSAKKRFENPEQRLKMSIAIKGFKHTAETRKKMSLVHKKNPAKTLFKKGNIPMHPFAKGNKMFVGSKNPNWKGGITPINRAIRNSFEYEEWRKKVFERDLYTCQICGDIGGKLNADHIKPFALYPELRFELSNGRTLCEYCHRKTDTFGVNAIFIKGVYSEV